MQISEIILNIKNNDIVVPEFQREYVWKRDKAKELLISLIKDYPVGGLLLWKTTSPPALKNIAKLPERWVFLFHMLLNDVFPGIRRHVSAKLYRHFV